MNCEKTGRKIWKCNCETCVAARYELADDPIPPPELGPEYSTHLSPLLGHPLVLNSSFMRRVLRKLARGFLGVELPELFTVEENPTHILARNGKQTCAFMIESVAVELGWVRPGAENLAHYLPTEQEMDAATPVDNPELVAAAVRVYEDLIGRFIFGVTKILSIATCGYFVIWPEGWPRIRVGHDEIARHMGEKSFDEWQSVRRAKAKQEEGKNEKT